MHIWRALVLQHQWALDNPGRNNSAEKDNAGGGVCLFTKILRLSFMYISLDTLDTRRIPPLMQRKYHGESESKKKICYMNRKRYLPHAK